MSLYVVNDSTNSLCNTKHSFHNAFLDKLKDVINIVYKNVVTRLITKIDTLGLIYK